jgi:hypothetical protein
MFVFIYCLAQLLGYSQGGLAFLIIFPPLLLDHLTSHNDLLKLLPSPFSLSYLLSLYSLAAVILAFDRTPMSRIGYVIDSAQPSSNSSYILDSYNCIADYIQHTSSQPA